MDLHLVSMVLVDIIPCILFTSNIWSDLYRLASGIIADLVTFCVVAFKFNAAWAKIVLQRSLRSSRVVLEFLFSDRNVWGIFMSRMNSSHDSGSSIYSLLMFDIMSDTILADTVLAFS